MLKNNDLYFLIRSLVNCIKSLERCQPTSALPNSQSARPDWSLAVPHQNNVTPRPYIRTGCFFVPAAVLED